MTGAAVTALPVPNVLAGRMGPVPRQGLRPICLPIAVSVAHQVARSTSASAHEPLSPESVWAHAARAGHAGPWGVDPEAVAAALLAEGQPLLDQWPLDSSLAGGAAGTVPASCPLPMWLPATFKEVFAAFTAGALQLQTLVRAGIPVVLLLDVTEAFDAAGDSGVVADASNQQRQGLHAVVIAGVALNSDGRLFFLLRNSWGDGWGQDGFCVASAEHVIEYGESAWTLFAN